MNLIFKNVFLSFYLLFFGFVVNAQDSISTQKSDKILINHTLDRIECEYCEVSVELFHEAFQKKMNFSSDIIEAMRTLLIRCEIQKICDFKAKTKNLKKLLSGDLQGGPLSDSKYRIWFGSKNIEDKKSRFYLNYDKTIEDFRNAFALQQAPDCKECKKLVAGYYNSWAEKKDIAGFKDVSQPSEEYKNKVLLCKNQRYKDCNKEMDSQIDELSFQSVSSKWRLESFSNNPIIIIDKKINVLKNNDIIYEFKGKVGVMDSDGFVFIKPKFDKVLEVFFQKSSYFVTSYENKLGFIGSDGLEIFPEKYDDLKFSSNPNCNFIAYKIDNKWGLMNDKFASINETKYDNVIFTNHWNLIEQNGKISFLDNKGTIIEGANYDSLIDSLEFRIPSQKVLGIVANNKIGLVGIESELIVPPIYEEIGYKSSEVNGRQLIDGNIPVKLNGKYGVLDELGNVIIEPKYDEIKYFLDGFAIVKLNSKYGMINLQGVEIIKPLYDNSFQFIDKVATVSLNGRIIEIDINGKEIINSKSDSSYSSLIEGTDSLTNNNISSISYVRIGNIDIQTSDLGEMNYYQAKSAIENLGQGWRFPNEQELILMFQNQDKIGALSKKELTVVNGYYRYGLGYLGIVSNGNSFVTINTYLNPGLTYVFGMSFKENIERSYYFIRAVRDVPEVKKAIQVVANSNKKYSAQKKIVSQTNNKTLYTNTCKLCGRVYNGDGYGYRIINDGGKRKLEVLEAYGSNMGAFNIVKNNFNTYECARNAGEKELRGY